MPFGPLLVGLRSPVDEAPWCKVEEHAIHIEQEQLQAETVRARSRASRAGFAKHNTYMRTFPRKKRTAKVQLPDVPRGQRNEKRLWKSCSG
mmetsp:Transcript_16018/g.29287  ORF Transcript_16018/g.29287 Transcript_16018/m.29287 type:complete len:91 (+) Transcript_16018:4451-4723(+)